MNIDVTKDSITPALVANATKRTWSVVILCILFGIGIWFAPDSYLLGYFIIVAMFSFISGWKVATLLVYRKVNKSLPLRSLIIANYFVVLAFILLAVITTTKAVLLF